MKKVDLFLVFICSLLGWTALPAQTTDHVLGELLVQLRAGEDAHRWARGWANFAGRPTDFRVQDCPSRPLNIWLFHFDHGKTNELRLLSSIRRDPAVVAAQFNHFIDLRETIPEDPFFDRQWHHINTGQNEGLENADLDMDLAWDITTGGLTADGDTIVVCVVDDGVNFEHEDLAANLWVNRAEIPDNGIDDDLNGYVDDYRGWNVLQDNDNVGSGGTHGTSVTGIIGAVGNNGIGVAGINWRVKLMMVKSNFNTTEATVIEAYSYPLIQRMRYNASNGQEGALVVATNSSWGQDLGFAEDAPIWCSLYDSLGVQGILSCGATANRDVDVDVEGDLPTTCPSDFLISVTNMDRNDEKLEAAGYGAVNIDLGAYGQEIFTTTFSDYGLFRGSSSATPNVTGAIALLYSAPCPSLMAVAKSDPAGAALLMRRYILEGVTPNSSLEGITATNGRLNVYNSLQLLLSNCGDCQPPTSINPREITDQSAVINWIPNDSISRVDLRYRIVGMPDWTEFKDAAPPFALTGLQVCTDYEFQVRTYCGEEELPYTGSRVFKTDGCCEAPELVRVSDITDNSATVSWPFVLAADQYVLRWRMEGAADWEEVITVVETIPLTGLTTCTNYEYQLMVNCSDERTASSPVYRFNTSGCGVCRESDYCNPGTYDAADEWISRVAIGTLDNLSENNNGYGLFTELEPPLIEQSGRYDILLKAGFMEQAFSEYFQVWIDFDQDGVFASEELIFDPGMTTMDSLIGQVSIPENAKLGDTRMRVAMRFQQPTSPCSQFGNNIFGEVEDYCLQIIPATNCNLPAAFDTVFVGSDEAQLRWKSGVEVSDYNVRYRPLSTDDWNSLSVSDTIILISGLDQCTAYEAQVQSDCGISQSIFLGNLLFNTNCINAVNEPRLVDHWKVYPNPFREQMTVAWELQEQPGASLSIQVLSTSGQILRSQQEVYTPGRQQIVLPTGDLPAGVYLVRLTAGGRLLAVERAVKMK